MNMNSVCVNFMQFLQSAHKTHESSVINRTTPTFNLSGNKTENVYVKRPSPALYIVHSSEVIL